MVRAIGVGFKNIDGALRTCEIAILLLDHDEFKMIPPAKRCHLDVIDTRGIRQDVPVRTGTSLETISAETGVVFGKGRPHGLEA